MSLIEKLTAEQEAKLPAYAEKWEKIGLDTSPADRPRAEEGIRRIYARAGLAEPEILWFGSPDAAIQRILADKNDGSDRHKILNYETCFGQHDASWLGFHEFFHLETELKEETRPLEGLWEIAKSAGWFFPYEGICYVCERLCGLHRDERARLHRDGGKAIEYPDGDGFYAWHGVSMPEKYGSVRSEQWKAEWLLEEKNAELRRVLLQGIGYHRLLRDLTAMGKKVDVIHEYKDMRLIRIADVLDVEPIVLLKVVCPSSGLEYVLRVPPDSTDCEQARMWTLHNEDGGLNFIAES